MRNLPLLVLITACCIGLPTEAASDLPKVINSTKSLKVGHLEANRKEYKLLLRNTSQVAVAGVAIQVLGSNGVCDLHSLRATHGVLIPPSEETELDLDAAKKKPEWFGPGGESCSDSTPDTFEERDNLRGSSAIIVSAADFEDGTYEGDSLNGAMMESIRIGNQTGRERIAALVEEELRTDKANDNKRIDRIQSKVESLSDEPDPTLVSSTMDRFPFLPAASSASIQRDLQAGLIWQKTLFLNNLKLYIQYRSSGVATRTSLQQWWTTTEGQCELLYPQPCEGNR